MLLCVNMFDFDITICYETPEVMMFYCNVLGTKSHLWSNHGCDCPFIVFFNCDFFFENNSQHLQTFTLKLEYKFNPLNETQKM